MTERECRRMLYYMLGWLSPAEYDMSKKKKRKMARKNAKLRKFKKVYLEYVEKCDENPLMMWERKNC